MKQDPVFIFSAYVKNKLSGAAMRVARTILKLRRISRDLKNKDIDDVIEDLRKADRRYLKSFLGRINFSGN